MANDAAVAVKQDTAGTVPPEQYAPDAVWREAERLLYREARLLDTERLSDWLEQIVDPTIRYMVVSRELRFRKEKRYGQPAEVFMYDDDYGFLKARVDQFHSGMQWRVDPPERYRRLVTNVEVFETGKDGEFAAQQLPGGPHAPRLRDRPVRVLPGGRPEALPLRHAAAGAATYRLRRALGGWPQSGDDPLTDEKQHGGAKHGMA